MDRKYAIDLAIAKRIAAAAQQEADIHGWDVVIAEDGIVAHAGAAAI